MTFKSHLLILQHSTMRYAIAVDVGIRNLGLCVFDFCTATFVFWDNITLVPNGRYIASNNVKYVRDFVARFNHFFSEAAVVLVERQMRCNMRIIESVLHTMFFDRCIIINARSVKAHYKLSTRNYRLGLAFLKIQKQIDETIKNFKIALSAVFDGPKIQILRNT